MLWSQWCLEVSGRQNGSSVSASNCGLIGPPVVVVTGNGEGDDDGAGNSLPIAALDSAGQMVAHVDLSGPPQDSSESVPPIWPASVLVHFAGTDPQNTSDLVRESLREGHFEGELLVVSVLQPGAQRRSRQAVRSDLSGAALVFAEDFEGLWASAFDGEPGAARLLNTRTGVAWRSEHPTAHELAAALASHAVVAPLPPRTNLRLAVGEGERAPDFLFDFGADTLMALRSLRGRPVLVTFFKSWSEPCRNELARLQTRFVDLSDAGWLVLAVADGQGVDATRELVEDLGLEYRVLADPERQIARKYGVHAWPTTVAIDGAGVIQRVQIGAAPETQTRKYS
jgi:peroxiredoxin